MTGLPPIATRSQDKGSHSELRVASALKRYGWAVMFPYEDGVPFDLVTTPDGSSFWRVQVKASTFNGTSVVFRAYNSSNTGRDNRTEYTSDDIDAFATYSNEQDQCYWIPVDDVDVTCVSLNTTTDDAVRPASKYEIDMQLPET